MTLTTKTDEELKEDQNEVLGDGQAPDQEELTDDQGSEDVELADGGDSTEDGADTEEPKPLPHLAYRMDEEDRRFEYEIVQRDDGIYDLSDDSKERIGNVLPAQSFQGRYDRSEDSRRKLDGEASELRGRMGQKDEEIAKIKDRFSPFNSHVELLKNPAIRAKFEREYAQQLTQVGYDPQQVHDPNAAQAAKLTHQQGRLDWETKARPGVHEVQKAALREVAPEISDDEVQQVMSYLDKNQETFLPELIPDPEYGYPMLGAQSGVQQKALLRKIASAPVLARKIMVADGLIKSPKVEKLEKENATLMEDFDRARTRVRAKSAGAGTSGTAPTGKKKEVSPMPRDPVAFAAEWAKQHPDEME